MLTSMPLSGGKKSKVKGGRSERLGMEWPGLATARSTTLLKNANKKKLNLKINKNEWENYSSIKKSSSVNSARYR